MRPQQKSVLITLQKELQRILFGPQVLAFLPALVLAAYWTAGEVALLVVAIGVPFLALLAGGFQERLQTDSASLDAVTNLPLRNSLESRINERLAKSTTGTDASAAQAICFIVEIEEFARFRERHSPSEADTILQRIAERLETALRDGDLLTRLGAAQFGICLGTINRLDLETGVQVASRLQAAVEDPLSINGQAVYFNCSVGFCLASRSPRKVGEALIDNAIIALGEALRNGPSAIRSYSIEMGEQKQKRDTMRSDSVTALERGEIIPWFQPQVSTDTGEVTGFEALARWFHPEKGIIPPGDFLPALEEAGQMQRLGEAMRLQALTALCAWDAAGLNVPCVAVNFTGEELRDPRLTEKIRWDLDRFDLDPSRLTVEVLETVIAGAPEDTAARNLAKLSEMGCRIDLDDFGTGHASITAIRQFTVNRLKIDRSFVSHVDTDAEQQRMVSAILTMAERLGLETLGEGVENSGEHNMLAQLGCGHVQGFGIARPMPFDQTIDWIRGHRAKVGKLPHIGRKSG
ncbi:MAG: diguanylate cyclase [Rhodobacterales bacterium]|nr:MAG: diguanylate cyclase [Rhodobacterales bacterium]